MLFKIKIFIKNHQIFTVFKCMLTDAYNGNENNIVVPKTLIHNGEDIPVKEIASFAFSNSEILTDVTLPEGIVRIGAYSFYKCNNLSYVYIPKSVNCYYWESKIGAGPYL